MHAKIASGYRRGRASFQWPGLFDLASGSERVCDAFLTDRLWLARNPAGGNCFFFVYVRWKAVEERREEAGLIINFVIRLNCDRSNGGG